MVGQESIVKRQLAHCLISTGSCCDTVRVQLPLFFLTFSYAC